MSTFEEYGAFKIISNYMYSVNNSDCTDEQANWNLMVLDKAFCIHKKIAVIFFLLKKHTS